MRLRTLPVLTRTLVLTTVAVGTLTPASLAVAGAASPSSAKTPHRGNPVTDAEAFFTCAHDQTRVDRVQRIKHSFGQELASIRASENQASKANKPTLAAYWKFDLTRRQHDETYLVKYWQSVYAKHKKGEIYILDLHKKGDAVTRGKARLKACKLSKLTFPPSKAAPAKPPASAPSTTAPAAKKPPNNSSTTTTPPAKSTTTTPPATPAPAPRRHRRRARRPRPARQRTPTPRRAPAPAPRPRRHHHDHAGSPRPRGPERATGRLRRGRPLGARPRCPRPQRALERGQAVDQ